MNEIARINHGHSPVGNTALTPTSMESAIKLAEMMAMGKLVPTHLQKSPGDCLMVIEASMRWQMSPFAVAQCTSVIQGKLMFEGKLVAAALNASGILSARLDYEFSGANGQRAVTVRGTLRGETKPREVTVALSEAKTSNSLWARQPDQQLVYAGTRVWARRHAPEVMLGVYAPEEFDRSEPPHAGPTIEAETREAHVAKIAPVYDVPAASVESAPPTRTDAQWTAWLDRLRQAVAAATSRAEVAELGARPSVAQALSGAPQWVRDEVNALLAAAFAALPEEQDLVEELAAVEDGWPGPKP